jgi:hypothetical protein
MLCPKCDHTTAVIDTRNRVNRRRQCPSCGYVFLTVEVLALRGAARTVGRTPTVKQVEFVLAQRADTQAGLVERTGLSLATISRTLSAMREAQMVYVRDWIPHPHGGPDAAVFALGDKPDAKRRVAATDAARTRRMRAAMRKSGEWEDVKAKRRARYHASKPAPAAPEAHPDPLMRAMYCSKQ